MSRRLRGGALPAAAALMCCLAASPALAQNVGASQLRTLAREAAAGSAAALTQLRSVSSIDGQPVQLATVLNARTPADLHARLVALAFSAAGAAPISSPVARQTAASILAAHRLSGTAVKDPLSELLGTIGHALASLASHTPGGPLVFWILAACLALGLTTIAARRALARLDPAARGMDLDRTSSGPDPATLEREAARAEQRGAFAEAVRLRFRAGLLRLHAQPCVRNGELARRLGSPQFDALAATFDRVTYGHADAGRADSAAAREGWPKVLRERR